MKTSFVVMLFVLCAAIFPISGCDCGGGSDTPDGSSTGDAGSTDTGPTVGTPVIEFKNPVDKAILTPGQDQSAAVEGIQYDVTVETTNVETGRQVVLTNSIDVPVKTYPAPVTVDPVSKKGTAIFYGVTFKNGDNVLTATAANSAGKTGTKVVTITANEAVDCTFTAPAEGKAFTAADDADGATPGLQTAVDISCRGVEADNTVTLYVNQGLSATAKIAGGIVSFAGVTLPEGASTITAAVKNNAGIDAVVTPVHVTVNTGACLAKIVKPVDGTIYLENGSGPGVVLDADLATAGMQAALELETAFEQYNQRCTENSIVTWTITTPDATIVKTSPIVKDANNKYLGKLDLTFDEAAPLNGAAITIAAKVEETVGTDLRSGNALTVAATVDSVAPSATITTPVADTYYNLNQDVSPLPGFQLNVIGTATGAPAMEQVFLMIDAATNPTPPTVALGSDAADVFDCPTPGAACAVEFHNVTVEAGTHALRLHVADASGNWYETADTTIIIDLDEPVIQFVWPASGQTLLAADDEDANTAGLQTSKIALTTMHIEDGQRGELRVSGSTPFAFTVTGAVAVFDDQYVTIPEGAAILLDAVVKNKADVTATQVPSPMQVGVDIHAPTVAIVEPADGTTIDTNTVTVNVQMTGVEAGQAVKLAVCDKDGANCASQPDATTANNRATFADVPLNAATAAQPNTLKVDVSDKAGNPAPTAVAKVTVDQSVPVLAFVAPVDLATLDTAADKDANLANGVQYDVVADATGVKVGGVAKLFIIKNGKTGAPMSSAAAVVQGAGVRLTWTSVTLPEGQFALKASYTNDFGKVGSAQVAVTVNTGRYTVDITEPIDGAALSTAADKDTNTAGVQVDVKAETSAPQGTPCMLTITNTGTSVAASTVAADGTVTFAFADVTLVDGANTLQVHCGTGVTAGDSLTSTVTVDLTAPTVSFVAPVDAQVYNIASVSSDFKTGFAVNVTVACGAGAAACEDDAAATLTVTLQGGATVPYSATFKTNQAQFKNVQISTVDFAANDRPTLSVVATDLAGNASAPVAITLTVDRVAPVINVTNPAKTTLGIADDENLLKADLQTRFIVAISGGSIGQLVHLDISGVTTYTATKAITNATTENLVFPVDLKDGVSLVRIYTSDDVGNASDTGQVSYTIDVSVPELQVFDKNSAELKNALQYVWNKSFDTDAAAGFQGDFFVTTKGLANSSTVKLCSSNTGGAGTVCDFGGGAYRVLSQGTVVISGGQTVGSVTMKAIAMVQGVHSVFAEAKDDVGNKGQSGTFQITVDSVPPTIAGIVVNSNNAANDKSPDIMLGIGEDANGNLADGMQAALTVTTTGVEDGLVLTIVDHGTTNVGTATVTGNSAVFSIAGANLVTLSDGTHSLTAVVSDKAGNAATGSPTVSIVSDGTAPTMSFAVPIEYKGGAWLTQAECTANPGYGCTFNGTNLNVNTALTIGDNKSLVGQKVAISGGVAGAEYTITGSTGSSVVFAAYVYAQGANNLSATMTDMVGNSVTATREVDVDTIAASVAFVTPNTPSAGSPTVWTVADDKDADPTNGLQSDKFVVSVTGVTDNTSVEIQRRPATGGTFAAVQDGSASFAADNSNFGFSSAPYPTLAKGNYELRLKATDAKLNITYSTSIFVNVNLAVPAVALEKASGDGAIGTADDLNSGAKFLVADATDMTGGIYKTTVVVVSDVLSGANARLWVNDVEQTAVPLNAGKASFLAVTLNQYPATNKIKGSVQDPVSLVTTNEEITGVIADGVAPTVVFTNPASPKTFTAADDADGNGGNGLQFKPADVVKITTTGVENGQQAVLKCTIGGSAQTLAGDTVVVNSNAAQFDALVLPTKHQPYDCTVEVSDAAGNKAADPTHLALTVDVTPPGDTKYKGTYAPIACIGETTDTTVGVTPEEKEHADCAALCKTTKCSPADYEAGNCTCSRRRGHVTLAWTAPADDAEDATSGKVTDYEVRWQKDTSVLHDCSLFDWNTAITSGVEKGVIVDPGQTQTAVIRGLTIHNYYCIAVKSIDLVTNGSSPNFAYSRERKVPFILTLYKSGSGSAYGNVVLSKCDFNGDGYSDVVVSAYSYSSNSGAVNLYYSNSALPDFVAIGSANARFGRSLGCGDYNGDGYDDLLVGAYGAATNDGRGYLFFGSSNGLPTTANSTPNEPDIKPNVVITAPAGSLYLLGLSVARDRFNFNGDKSTSGRNIDDFAFATRGSSNVKVMRVFKGRSDWSGITSLDASNPDLSFTSETSNGGMRSISAADIDGDGYSDFVIGVDNLIATALGKVYILFGGPSLSGTVDYSDSSVIKLSGSTMNYGSVTAAGDVTLDNAGELFVAATDNYRVYSYSGVLNDKSKVTTGGDFQATGSTWFGSIMALVQFDGTRRGLLVGGQGKVYLYHDPSLVFSGFNSVIEGTGNFGMGLDGGGDINKDGFEDAVITDPSGNGAVYILK